MAKIYSFYFSLAPKKRKKSKSPEWLPRKKLKLSIEIISLTVRLTNYCCYRPAIVVCYKFKTGGCLSLTHNSLLLVDTFNKYR